MGTAWKLWTVPSEPDRIRKLALFRSAILHHKDTIKWIGDNGESIDVPEMLGVRCSDHTKRDTPADGDLSLISQISPSGNIVTAQVTANKKNENYCYKNTIRVTVNGKTTPIDPHEFLEQ